MDTKQKSRHIYGFYELIAMSTKPDVTRRNYQIIAREFNVQKFISNEIVGGYNPNDIWIEKRNGEKKHIEIKNYFNHNNSNLMCLEQYTDHQKGIRGWVHHLIQNKTDYVLFTWHGKSKSCYLVLDGFQLNNWWEKHSEEYDIRLNGISKDETTGNTWQSSFSKVPIKDLPNDIICLRKQFVDLNDFWGYS